MDQQCQEPSAREPTQAAPGMADPLHEPDATVNSGEDTGMQRQVHHPLEMLVCGITRIGRSVPANRHEKKQQSDAFFIVALPLLRLTEVPSMESDGFGQALVAQRIRASDYGSEGREFESLQAR